MEDEQSTRDEDASRTDHGLDLVAIAAVAANGVIGVDGSIPWHIPEDLAHFKETTMGHPVLVGRRTFENIVDRLGEPLPGRTNVVLSRGAPDLPEDAVHARDLEEAIDAARATGADRAFVMGGTAVYEAAMDRVDRLVLTELDEAHEGDAQFPAWPPGDEWQEVDRDERDGFAFVTYERAE